MVLVWAMPGETVAGGKTRRVFSHHLFIQHCKVWLKVLK